MQQHDFKAWLETEFSRRRQKNQRYSLRMFANHLQVPSGRLSEILSGKRRLTASFARKAGLRLGLNPAQLNQMIEAMDVPADGSTAGHGAARAEYQQVSIDSFNVLSDWYHFAILNLMDTKDFQSDVKWIADRLALSTVEVRSAIERLERLGMIETKPDGLIKTVGHLETTHDLESAALRSSHRQSLEQAIQALEDVAIELRDITSITMAIDMKRIPQAKEIIQKFRRDLCAYLEQSDERTEVYNLNVQLVPVTKVRHDRGNKE